MEGPGVLHFHSPCLDGVASAVILSDFLVSERGRPEPALKAVNYSLRGTWLSTRLPPGSSVVDFLFHPDAEFWADHHGTTFLTGEARAVFERPASAERIYSPEASSCALLLWERLLQRHGYRNPDYQELVESADLTDSARYDSVDQALFSPSPGLEIHSSLSVDADEDYTVSLVRALRSRPVAEVAGRPEVRRRFREHEELTRKGLERMAASVRLEAGEIAVFDVDEAGGLVNRYSPYRSFPRARYSVGIVRSPVGAKITAMRNPWMEFPSVPLGEICAELGGGGHPRVGSVVLQGAEAVRASEVLGRILSEIRRRESSRETRRRVGKAT